MLLSLSMFMAVHLGLRLVLCSGKSQQFYGFLQCTNLTMCSGKSQQFYGFLQGTNLTLCSGKSQQVYDCLMN